MDKELLTPDEIARLIMFNQDEALKSAVKKVILSDIYNAGVLGKAKKADGMNWAYSIVYQHPERNDELIGQNLRGIVMGLSMLEEAFKRIELYKAESETEEESNPAL